MSSAENLVPDAAPTRPASEYADQMPLLREFAALPVADPRRQALRDDLVLAFMPVVRHLARRHSNDQPAVTYEDLVQAGSIALITAIDRWDPALARGEFLGYLIPCVRGEMLRWFRDRTWAVRVPRRLKELGSAIGRVTGPMSQDLGRAPRPSELAARLGESVGDIVEALDARANRYAGPLDVVEPDTGIPLIERLGDLDHEMEKVEYRQVLRPLVQALPERERTIVMLRFFGEMTQTQIAEQVGVSQMHVSRLLARSLATLRRGMTADA
jgi:RNA polymerase sigma-B factor